MKTTFLLLFSCIYIQNSISQVTYIEKKVVANDRESEDLFGQSVDVYQNLSVAGAVGEKYGTGVNAGAAYVYKHDIANNSTTQVAKLFAPIRQEGDLFGVSVSIDDNFLVVGASQEDEDQNEQNTLNNAGAVYIYKKNTNGTWSFHQKIVASNRAEFHYFGNSVDINKDYLIVGATGYDTDNQGNHTLNYSGAAYIFKRMSNNQWQEVGKLLASDRAAYDVFGISVAINNQYAVVGAYNESENSSGQNTLTGAGSAYVFKRNNTVWIQQQKIVAPDRKAAAVFGSDVSMYGDNLIAVGAPGESTNANNTSPLSQAGAVYMYKRGTTSWQFQQKLVPSERKINAVFGNSVSLGSSVILVGASGEKNNSSNLAPLDFVGAAYVFTYKPTWTQEKKLMNYDRAAYDRFGMDVSFWENYIIVGAFNEDEDQNGSNTLNAAGSAYLYYRKVPSAMSISSDNDKINENAIDVISSQETIIDSEKLYIYPNPMKDVLQIYIKDRIQEVEVYNVTGNLLIKQFPSTDELITLQTSDLDSGVYIIKVKTATKTLVSRVVKSK